MILNDSRCKLSLRLSKNSLSKGNERRPPCTRLSSAVARTFASLASKRLSQSAAKAGFLESPELVGSDASWERVDLPAPAKSNNGMSRNKLRLASM